VRVQELLFALARDARLNVDINPDITGTVTLNAIDQTLPQLLTRIARQVDMRYEIDGQNLIVMRDTPLLRIYKIDYVNLARDAKSIATLSTQISGGALAGGSANNSTAQINSVSVNKFWDTLVANVKDILRETDKVLPAGAAAQSAAVSTTAPVAPVQPAAPGAAPTAQPAPPAEFREAASVIANAEAGILSIRATSRQHEKIQEFLDQVMVNATRQVLIEATVAEVQLNNQYQRGIDWSKLRSGGSGIQIQQSSAVTPAGINTGAFIVGYASARHNFTSAI
jgi:general secretion pathway protein D